MLSALILDIDGTLIDSNDAHVDAWVEALASFGYRIPRDRMLREVGKGADQLIPSVVGATVEREQGDAIRIVQRRAFAAIAAARPLPVFPGVHELVSRARKAGLRIALATSSAETQIAALERSSGLDLHHLGDALVGGDDAGASKPAPDVVLAAAAALGVMPAECAMAGDTIYDAEACRSAGVVCLGVTSGGAEAGALRCAGARAVWRDVEELGGDLGRALEIASPGSIRLDRRRLEALMREALAEARRGLAAGEMPVGALLVRGDGTIVSRGYDMTRGTRDATAHAEIVALRQAAGLVARDARDTILVSTREPCVMCTGAAIEAAVDTIVYAAPMPGGGTSRVTPGHRPDGILPRVVGGIAAEDSRALAEWRR
jgi:HAD superfamily hydrolase (TIGR01549 family)